MADGALLRATAKRAAPSAKQITSYPPADKTIERVSRTAGSSSTTKISPRGAHFSPMCPSSIAVKNDAHAPNGTALVQIRRGHICKGARPSAQVAPGRYALLSQGATSVESL